MRTSRLGFTIAELLVVLVVVGALFIVLTAVGHRSRTGDGATESMIKLSRIIQASQMYHADHMGQVPLRGTRYTNGSLNGWDTWNVGGKNCNVFWQTNLGGTFDESAFSRFLNPYVYSGRIPQPPGYVNTGSGTTWTFNDGTPTVQQRLLQMDVFRSPGDVATRQRTWPSPTPGVSCYNDVGTSYLSNMKWWDQPGLPSGFTQRFNEGCNRIGLAFSGANPNFVFMHDQTADIVANAAPGSQLLGEFGKYNASMCGFADGRVAYIQLVPGAFSGPGYTFTP